MVHGDLWFGHTLKVNRPHTIPLEMSQRGGQEAGRVLKVAADTNVVVAEYCRWDTHQVPVQFNREGQTFYIARYDLSEGAAGAAV